MRKNFQNVFKTVCSFNLIINFNFINITQGSLVYGAHFYRGHWFWSCVFSIHFKPSTKSWQAGLKLFVMPLLQKCYYFLHLYWHTETNFYLWLCTSIVPIARDVKRTFRSGFYLMKSFLSATRVGIALRPGFYIIFMKRAINLIGTMLPTVWSKTTASSIKIITHQSMMPITTAVTKRTSSNNRDSNNKIKQQQQQHQQCKKIDQRKVNMIFYYIRNIFFIIK